MFTRMIRFGSASALALSVAGCTGIEVPSFMPQSQAAAPVPAPAALAPVEATPEPVRSGRNPFRDDNNGGGGGGGGSRDNDDRDSGWG